MISISWTLLEGQTEEDVETAQGADVVRDLALDEDGDIYVDATGDLAVVSGREAIASDVLSALQLIKGEWFKDRSAGVNYFDREDGMPAVFGKIKSIEVVKAIFRDAILAREGITGVPELELIVNTDRSAELVFSATSDLGVLNVAGLEVP